MDSVILSVFSTWLKPQGFLSKHCIYARRLFHTVSIQKSWVMIRTLRSSLCVCVESSLCFSVCVCHSDAFQRSVSTSGQTVGRNECIHSLLKARMQDRCVTPEVRGQTRQMSAADAVKEEEADFLPSRATLLIHLNWKKSGCHGDPAAGGQPASLPAITVVSLPRWARRAAEKTSARRKRLLCFSPLSSASNHCSCCLQLHTFHVKHRHSCNLRIYLDVCTNWSVSQ